MATYFINSAYSTNDILKVKETQLQDTTSISDPLNFSLPLALDIEGKSSSSSNASTSSSVYTSPSPVSSSSTSSLSSLSSSPAKVIKTTKDPTNGDEFYQYLQNHSSLLRIVLHKEFPLKIVDGQWYRLDLQVVNELGLPLGEWRAKDAIMGLACELLELIQENEEEKNNDDELNYQGSKKRKIQDINKKHENRYSLTWRALQFDAWEWDESVQVPGFAGFERCNKGGLEFKININNNGDDEIIKNHHHQRQQLPRFFMRIIPTFESHQTIHALPLVVGPFSIMNNDDNSYSHHHPNHHRQRQHTNNNSNKKKLVQCNSNNNKNDNNGNDHRKGDLWIMNLWYQEMYRAFKLNIQGRYFLVKEGWTLGTPGKMWDSALVLSDILVRRIVDHPDCFHQRHILDLSAGTGIVGLLVAFYYQHLYKQYHAKVTLTDLPEAIHLIQHNQKLNDIKTNRDISTEPLQWGNMHDIKRIRGMKKPIDVIIASDVLYLPSNFKVLVDTLAALSTPGRTVIYLGYKRRGLDVSDENYFFELCYKHFHLQLIKNDGDVFNDIYNNNNSNSNEKEESTKQQKLIKPVYWEKRFGGLNRDKDHIDAYGWLGPCVKNCKKTTNVNYQETGVQIFRLIKRQA